MLVTAAAAAVVCGSFSASVSSSSLSPLSLTGQFVSTLVQLLLLLMLLLSNAKCAVAKIAHAGKS